MKLTLKLTLKLTGVPGGFQKRLNSEKAEMDDCRVSRVSWEHGYGYERI